MKFPVIRQKFPDPRNIFPVNFLREFVKSRCSTAAFRYEIGSQSSRIAKFPAKFPVSRESAWRRVRSALRCQPKIVGVKQRISLRIAKHSQRFHVASCRKNFRFFSRLPNFCRRLHATWTQHGFLPMLARNVEHHVSLRTDGRGCGLTV
jgi:hypothetical protein